MYKPKVYTASKIPRHTLWKELKASPSWDHVDWTARWVHMVDEERETTPALFAHFWTIDMQDVRRSDFVLLYAAEDAQELRGGLVEAGMGLAFGKTVLAIDLPLTHSWSHHPLVVRLSSLDLAREFLLRYNIER